MRWGDINRRLDRVDRARPDDGETRFPSWWWSFVAGNPPPERLTPAEQRFLDELTAAAAAPPMYLGGDPPTRRPYRPETFEAEQTEPKPRKPQE